MRIPLDYYRILGLPIQATAEQLRQAHRDRTQQFPRREYSEATIVARKQLIDEAYAVLSDLEQRQTYDGSFLAKTYEPEKVEELSPSSEINLDKVEEKETKLQETGEVIP
ncbi:J domain-containing protein, partial [Hydrocoleum sp. CS-953]